MQAKLCSFEAAFMVNMQAALAAGYPSVDGMDLLDNVIPLIGGEEGKQRTEV